MGGTVGAYEEKRASGTAVGGTVGEYVAPGASGTDVGGTVGAYVAPGSSGTGVGASVGVRVGDDSVIRDGSLLAHGQEGAAETGDPPGAKVGSSDGLRELNAWEPVGEIVGPGVTGLNSHPAPSSSPALTSAMAMTPPLSATTTVLSQTDVSHTLLPDVVTLICAPEYGVVLSLHRHQSASVQRPRFDPSALNLRWPFS